MSGEMSEGRSVRAVMSDCCLNGVDISVGIDECSVRIGMSVFTLGNDNFEVDDEELFEWKFGVVLLLVGEISVVCLDFSLTSVVERGVMGADDVVGNSIENGWDCRVVVGLKRDGGVAIICRRPR